MTAAVPSELPYKPILWRVGNVCLLFGLADICVMILCIKQGVSYASSFNLFAVFLGLGLRKGSLNSAHTVYWWSRLFLWMFVALIGSALIFEPLPLWRHRYEIGLQGFHTGDIWEKLLLCLSIIYPMLFVLLPWVLRELGKTEIVEAQRKARFTSYNGQRNLSYYLSAAVPFIIFGLLSYQYLVTPHSVDGQKALQLARQKLGADYQYHLRSLEAADTEVQKKAKEEYSLRSFGTGEVVPETQKVEQIHKVKAVVAAYNTEQVHEVPVYWEERR